MYLFKVTPNNDQNYTIKKNKQTITAWFKLVIWTPFEVECVLQHGIKIHLFSTAITFNHNSKTLLWSLKSYRLLTLKYN